MPSGDVNAAAPIYTWLTEAQIAYLRIRFHQLQRGTAATEWGLRAWMVNR